MTYINRLRVSAPGCHPPGVFQLKGIQAQHASLGRHRPTRHTSHFARFIWTKSLRITKIQTDVCMRAPYKKYIATNLYLERMPHSFNNITTL